MNFLLLLITTCPSAGYGLSAEHFFGEQLARRLRQSGRVLTCHHHPMPFAVDVSTRFRALPLASYDLIVIQPDPADLIGADTGLSWVRWWLTGHPARGTALAMQTLVPLRAHRHRTLLLSPFPQRGWWQQQRVKQATRRLVELGEQTGLSVFDTGQLIGTGSEYFLPNDPARLNAVSHELVGSWLFDFYRQQPAVSPVSVGRGSRPGA